MVTIYSNNGRTFSTNNVINEALNKMFYPEIDCGINVDVVIDSKCNTAAYIREIYLDNVEMGTNYIKERIEAFYEEYPDLLEYIEFDYLYQK